MNDNKVMKLFKVTFKFTKLPWYTVTGIDADDKKSALAIATVQKNLEIGSSHKMKKPLVELTMSLYPVDSFGLEG